MARHFVERARREARHRPLARVSTTSQRGLRSEHERDNTRRREWRTNGRAAALTASRERELGALSLGGRRAPAHRGEAARLRRRRAHCGCCFVGKRGGEGAWSALLLLLSMGKKCRAQGTAGVLWHAGEEGRSAAAARGRMKRGVEEAGAEGEKSATAGQPWSREKGAPCAEERRTGVVAGKDSRGKGTMGVSSEIWAPSMEAATAALCSSSGMGGRRAGDTMGGAGRAPHSWKRELAATGRGGAEPPARWLLCVGGRRAAA
ncbi:hypothetical protein ZEAMMB73_Zm00001d054112 [Zea mays]|jgi:hypothetical protein|uniref:Uncharacterized protein n=1 Tax=Zea mays TaxID=4577 RepID=A0A1D6QVK4_MAIZE|nr:hypothetical protein ZEAMMB73_Zm00001d054112 [Zea mays]